MKYLKLTIMIIGMIAVISHMTYYALRPYGMIKFFLGFGIIYLVFVLPLKRLNKQ